MAMEVLPVLMLKEGSPVLFKEYYHFLQVPVGLKIYWGNERFRFYLHPGIQAEWYLGKRLALEKGSTTGLVETAHSLNPNYPFRAFNFLVSLGTGLEMKLQKRVALFMEPQVKTTLRTVVEDAPYDTRRLDLALRTGLKLNF